jgi:hypothetical protein
MISSTWMMAVGAERLSFANSRERRTDVVVAISELVHLPML